MTEIKGGITAPKGFKASGMYCGIRNNPNKKDLALIVCDTKAAAAGVYTTNKVYGAPVGVTRKHISENGYMKAAICNSGNANTCNTDGYDKANATCDALAKALDIKPEEVIVASTGVIGQPLPLEPIISAIPTLVEALADTDEASDAAARAIMTTDTVKKEVAYSFNIGEKEVRLAGIAKGSGMIEPNMATMLCFITTDANITPAMLQKALSAAVCDTFNMVSVDGDTSTNDTVTVMASGFAGNNIIDSENDDYKAFLDALMTLCTTMAKKIAKDGEGATKLLECQVVNFNEVSGAKKLAKSVIRSSLVKAAMFGADANWGRILCALGYSGVDFDPDLVDVWFLGNAGRLDVCKNGRGVPFDEDFAKKLLSENEITVICDMKCGDKCATAWGCDLTYEYVKINGDYRT